MFRNDSFTFYRTIFRVEYSGPDDLENIIMCNCVRCTIYLLGGSKGDNNSCIMNTINIKAEQKPTEIVKYGANILKVAVGRLTP